MRQSSLRKATANTYNAVATSVRCVAALPANGGEPLCSPTRVTLSDPTYLRGSATPGNYRAVHQRSVYLGQISK